LAKFKIFTIPVIILFAVVLGGLGYVLGSLLSSGSSAVRVAAQKNPDSTFQVPVPVTDFTLTDQTGKPFTFSSTKGKIVIMAFLYTHCGDVCPYLALKMKIAVEQLGDQGKDVELVAIDTDPARDTVPVLASYSKDLGLYDRWHIVTGSADAMKKVYSDLKITVFKSDDSVAQESVKNAGELGISLPAKTDADSYITGLNDTEVAAGSNVARKYYGGYQIVHSAPFWLVDANGNLRTSLDFSATPAQLAEAVKTYLKS
jgi:cytochrome oxidase Cu insertion factor (SCO1/SenC/PrrC family)